MKTVRISVRALIEFILRSGDIDNRTESGPDPEAMLAGGRIHRKIQRSMPSTYRAEVPLKTTFEDGDLQLVVEGRADGIDRRDGMVLVDEIKGVYADVTRFTEAKPLHLAQAYCYACMLAREEGLSGVTCQITYCDLDTEEIRRFQTVRTAEELETWMTDLAEQYFRWAHFQADHREERNRSGEALDFPYDYRPGQKRIAVDVFRAVRRSRNLFVQAPTGVGKTLSVLFPSVKAMAEGLTERIFYLTAKTVTASVAEENLQVLLSRGLDLLACTIRAKEKLCPNEVFECNPELCPYAKGHFDRVNDAVFELLKEGGLFTAERLLAAAEKAGVCPYEFALDVSVWCDTVIADYNYAFDPRVRLRRYFSEGTGGDYIFLVDEAHNLPDRASEMYSASLVKEDVLALKKLIMKKDGRASRALDRLNRAMLSLRRNLGDYPEVGRGILSGTVAELPDINFLMEPLTGSYFELSRLLEEQKNFPERKEVLTGFFEIRTFLETAEQAGEGYRIYARFDDDGFRIRLLCVDPSARLKKCLESARTTVFFSGTLLPVQYYKEMLTGNPEEYAIYTESPFDPENRLLLAASDVSSRYQRRTETEFRRIAEYLRITVSAKTGNYLAFFPSYEFLGKVEKVLRIPGTEILVQEKEMDEDQRRAFLSVFAKADGNSRLGLCVMGGAFSEGIDLAEDRLIGCIVVGTGLPAINPESELVKEYFDAAGKDGFDYAYRYPGMNKVRQAAGRLIRTDRDRGVILLLDDRFLTPRSRSLFPLEWADLRRTDLSRIEEELNSFWKKC
ncbi:MAG: ATP-dependent DNA helicase [Stomatobaculum sp.]|nr:ATP-dependent DNA helicase [Stomatobaculum sp.]